MTKFFGRSMSVALILFFSIAGLAGVPHTDKDMIQPYISKAKTCIITENTENSSYIRCDDAELVLLVALPFLETMRELFKAGFDQTMADQILFGGNYLNRIYLNRQ
jgi:hypothetical protein